MMFYLSFKNLSFQPMQYFAYSYSGTLIHYDLSFRVHLHSTSEQFSFTTNFSDIAFSLLL